MAERKMPQNLEAEMSILGACFLSTYALDKVCDKIYLEQKEKADNSVQPE